MGVKYYVQASGNFCVVRYIITLYVYADNHVHAFQVYLYVLRQSISWEFQPLEVDSETCSFHSSMLVHAYIAGTCVTSDTRVVRDIHYDGHPIEERATIITRIAPTFLRLLYILYIYIYRFHKFQITACTYVSVCCQRFGSFEIFKAQDPMTGRSGPSVGRTDILHQMLDYITSTFYPEVMHAHTLILHYTYMHICVHI